MRNAVLICEAFVVTCPYCGEAQANTNGSEMWTPDELDGKSHECQSCEKQFKLTRLKKAHVD